MHVIHNHISVGWPPLLNVNDLCGVFQRMALTGLSSSKSRSLETPLWPVCYSLFTSNLEIHSSGTWPHEKVPRVVYIRRKRILRLLSRISTCPPKTAKFLGHRPDSERTKVVLLVKREIVLRRILITKTTEVNCTIGWSDFEFLLTMQAGCCLKVVS